IRHDAISNADGASVITSPLEAGLVGRALIDVLGPTQPLTTMHAAAGVLEVPLADGGLAFGTVRSLYGSPRELAPRHGRSEARAVTSMRAAAGVLEVPLADGGLAFGTVRSLYGSNGELAIVHGRSEAMAGWTSDTALTITLSATTGFVVLILGFAFHWQATRAREADVIYETVRSRIDTALNRGRC